MGHSQVKEEEDAAQAAAIDDDYASALPEDIRLQVDRIVDKEMVYLRTTVERDYKEEADKLRVEIQALQNKVP